MFSFDEQAVVVGIKTDTMLDLTGQRQRLSLLKQSPDFRCRVCKSLTLQHWIKIRYRKDQQNPKDGQTEHSFEQGKTISSTFSQESDKRKISRHWDQQTP